MQQDIPGTTISMAPRRRKAWRSIGCAYSFNSAENRAAFLADEEAYCRKFGLNDEQRAAVKSRSVLKMIEAGGNVYYLAKLAGIFGLNVQDIGAQQTGMTRRSVQVETACQRGHDHGDRSSAASAPRTFRRSAKRSPKKSRTIPTGSRSSRASTTSTTGWRGRSPTSPSCSTTITA